MKLIIDILNFKKHYTLLTHQLKNHGKNGFTLVEIMIVVAMIAIIAAVLIPVTLQVLPDYRMKKAARNLLSDMQRARLNAIKNGLTWRVDFNDGAETYTIRDPNSSFGGDRAIDTADDILIATNVANYGSGVHMPPDGACGNAAATWSGAAIAQRDDVSFTSRGTCMAGSTFISNQNNTICYAVSTTAACAIKIRKYNGMLPFNTNHWID